MNSFKTIIFFFLLLLTDKSRLYSQKTDCYSYGPSVVTLHGVIKRHTFPGPPNYESIERGDRPETYWILQLETPICVSRDTSSELNVSENNIKELQLVLNEDEYSKHSNFLKIRVAVKGTLFHGFSGHHNTHVLITVNDILLANAFTR